MNIVACIDHRLARLESAARTFLRSDLHRREARAAVERDVFDLNAFEEENECLDPVSEESVTCPPWCCGGGGNGDRFAGIPPVHEWNCRVLKDVPADLAASGTGPGEVSATTPDLAPSPGQLLRDSAEDVATLIQVVLDQHGSRGWRNGLHRCLCGDEFIDGELFDRHRARIVLDATATALDALK